MKYDKHNCKFGKLPYSVGHTYYSPIADHFYTIHEVNPVWTLSIKTDDEIKEFGSRSFWYGDDMNDELLSKHNFQYMPSVRATIYDEDGYCTEDDSYFPQISVDYSASAELNRREKTLQRLKQTLPL